MTAQLTSADGKRVADATIDFGNGYATVTVETTAAGVLAPGFHGLHIHAVGKCDANSVAPTGGEPGDFLSAGDHLQAQGHTGLPASGDLPPLLVRSDGSGKLVATSDAFTEDELKGAEGSSIVLHEGSDDADKRIACGVISPASSTSTSATTSTSTVTSTVTPVPPATVTETTTSPTSPTSQTSSTTSSSTPTSVSTVTQTTITTTNIPIPIPTVPNG